jgi:hypothetical protein
MYGIMRALAMKKTEWMDELYFTMMFVQQKLSTHYAEVTSISSKHGSSPHILDRFRKFWSFTQSDKGMDNDPEDRTTYTTQYQEAFLKYVKNYCSAKH